MPLFDYQCLDCENKFEKMLSLQEYNKTIYCPKCDNISKKLITLGGIQDDHPKWLDGKIIRQLQDTDDPNVIPIESRTEYNKYLKDNELEPTG